MALPFILFAASTVLQAGASIEASAQQRRARKLQDRIEAVKLARERRRQAQQALRARAEIDTSAIASGAGFGSSAIQGAQGALTSDYASNNANLSTMQALGSRIRSANTKAANYQALGQVAGAVSNYSYSAFQDQGGWQQLFK